MTDAHSTQNLREAFNHARGVASSLRPSARHPLPVSGRLARPVYPSPSVTPWARGFFPDGGGNGWASGAALFVVPFAGDEHPPGKVIMVRISMFNDALKSMYNAKKRGKRLTKCGVISPRFDVGVNEIEVWTATISAVWLHCADNICWHRGPQGS
ncbi:hypothetical protein BS78_03G329800 [Paspalum vaginatum]|nr:hypothetical protein BS78_03G329800 [Paspalum vaginatum]